MPPLHVTVLDTGDPEHVSGGVSAFLRNIIPHLPASVRVAGLAREPSGDEWETRKLGRTSYQFLALGTSARSGHKPRVPDRLHALLKVAAKRRRLVAGTDVLYVHTPELALPFVVGSSRLPVVLHLHGATNPLTISRYPWARSAILARGYFRLLRVVIGRADRVISVDSAGRRMCGAIKGGDVSTACQMVPTCFDGDLFKPRAEAPAKLHEPGSSTRTIIFVGRLEEGKEVELLLRSFALVAKARADVLLQIVGDGSERPRLEEITETLGLEESVRFTGWLEPSSLAQILPECHVFALTSRAEGLPVAVLEALACGIPVVSSRVGDVGTVVQTGANGYLVDSTGPSDFARAILLAIDRTWDREAVAATVSSMSSLAVAEKVVAILGEAAHAGRRGRYA